MKTEKLQIEKEKRNYLGDFKPVIIAVIVLIILILLLVFVFRVDITKFGNKDKDSDNNNTEIIEKQVGHFGYSCSESELNKLIEEANKVKMSYKGYFKGGNEGYNTDTGELIEFKSFMFDITYSNISKNLYIVIQDNDIFNYDNGNSAEIKQEDIKDGKYLFEAPYNLNFVTYNVKIYSLEDSECGKELLREFEFTTPLYNSYRDYNICEDEDVEGFDLCEKETLTEEEFIAPKIFYQEIEKYRLKSREAKEQKEGEEIKVNTSLIVIITIIILIVITTVVIILRKKRRK